MDSYEISLSVQLKKQGQQAAIILALSAVALSAVGQAFTGSPTHREAFSLPDEWYVVITHLARRGQAPGVPPPNGS
jgi:hypothetical protein